MSIEVTRTSVQSMSYTREEVIERLVEGEDFDFRADDEPQNPAESRAAWGELSDTELAYHLALRLNDDGGGEEWLDNVVDDLYKGSDTEQWTCDGWTGNEPGSQLRDVITGEAIAARAAAAGAGQLEPSAGALTSTNDDEKERRTEPMSTNIIATKDLGTIDGFDIRAHIEPDEDGGASMHTDPTREELDAYRDGDWTFVGTVITASRGGVVLGSDSLWGSEYGSLPGVPGFVSPLDGEGTAFVNGYGPQMIAEAIAEAKAKLAEICQPAQKLDPRTWLPYPA